MIFYAFLFKFAKPLAQWRAKISSLDLLFASTWAGRAPSTAAPPGGTAAAPGKRAGQGHAVGTTGDRRDAACALAPSGGTKTRPGDDTAVKHTSGEADDALAGVEPSAVADRGGLARHGLARPGTAATRRCMTRPRGMARTSTERHDLAWPGAARRSLSLPAPACRDLSRPCAAQRGMAEWRGLGCVSDAKARRA